MTKNPLVNGLSATAYIVLIVSIINFGSKMMPKEDNLAMPIAFISLFTLSAAVMGYIFLYQPAQMYFDGDKKSAVKLFLQTVLVFGLITFTTLILLFFGIL